MALLGDDGRGYELARKLESQGVWRSWLGDALHSAFIPFLSSPAAWDAFMRTDDSKTKPQIHLQLRARALLFDKASVSLFIQSPLPAPVSKLNPHCKYFLLKLSLCKQSWMCCYVSIFGVGSRFYYWISKIRFHGFWFFSAFALSPFCL